jgi:uncharacterized protein (UPF0333 family)
VGYYFKRQVEFSIVFLFVILALTIIGLVYKDDADDKRFSAIEKQNKMIIQMLERSK